MSTSPDSWQISPITWKCEKGYQKKNVGSKLNKYILPRGWEKMEKTRNMIERKEKVLLFSTFLKRDPKKNIISRHIYGVFRNLPPPPRAWGVLHLLAHKKNLRPTRWDPENQLLNGVNYLYKNMAHLVPVKEPHILISRKSMVIF